MGGKGGRGGRGGRADRKGREVGSGGGRRVCQHVVGVPLYLLCLVVASSSNVADVTTEVTTGFEASSVQGFQGRFNTMVQSINAMSAAQPVYAHTFRIDKHM